MILRAAGIGLVLWLIEIAALRFAGPAFFTPDWAPSIAAFAVTGIVSALLMFVILKLLREAHGDEAEAALGVALPGLLLSAMAANLFPSWLPNLDPVLDGVYGAHMMVQAAAISFTGLFFTKLAAQDERV